MAHPRFHKLVSLRDTEGEEDSFVRDPCVTRLVANPFSTAMEATQHQVQRLQARPDYVLSSIQHSTWQDE